MSDREKIRWLFGLLLLSSAMGIIRVPMERRAGRAEQAKIDAAKPPVMKDYPLAGKQAVCMASGGVVTCNVPLSDESITLLSDAIIKQLRSLGKSGMGVLEGDSSGWVQQVWPSAPAPKPSKGSKARPHETPFEVQFLKEGWIYQNLHVDLVNKKVTGVCPEKEAAKVSKPHLFRCEGCKDDMGLTEFYCLNGCRPAAAPKPQSAPQGSVFTPGLAPDEAGCKRIGGTWRDVRAVGLGGYPHCVPKPQPEVPQ